MGCDGGSIPKRSEMVREQAKKESKDRNMARKARWFNCAITQQRLTQPIVSCRKGRLYNKEAVIEHILGINPNKFIAHIKKAKDIKTLNLTPNPTYKKMISTSEEVKGVVDTQCVAPYICPVTDTEMDGHCKFGFIWKCGCVLSEKAMKEVQSVVCHKCGKPYDSEDFILLNSEDILVDENQRQKNKGVGKKVPTKLPQSTSSLSTAVDKNTKNNSTIYKSLFTSCEEYQKKDNLTKNGRVMYSYF